MNAMTKALHDDLAEAKDEVKRLRASNAAIAQDREAVWSALQAKVAEADKLRAENAELRESLRRIVGHLEYELKQGDGLADDAVDDFVKAKSLLGQKVTIK